MAENNYRNLRKAIERVKIGGFKEYWLQQYIKYNYEKLGFNQIEGPFDYGYDFKGIYEGKKVVIEAEVKPKNFLLHRHNKEEVDILIVETLDNTDDKLLPKKIIKIDPIDFINSTHEMRKRYAIWKMKEEEWSRKTMPTRISFNRITSTFYDLWVIMGGKLPEEDTPEANALDNSIEIISFLYTKIYNVNLENLSRREGSFTNIEILTNDLIKSRKEFKELPNKDKEFLKSWYELLVDEFNQNY